MTEPLRKLPAAVMKVVLGTQLARLRDAAGAKQEDAAGVLGCTQQKIAHIESGSGIRLIELNALLDLYAANEADQAYTRDLQAESNHRTKRGAFSTRFRQYLRLLVDMEPSCNRYFSYQALVVPGLLQTESYMRENARAWRPPLSSDEIDKYATDRLARQGVLDDLDQEFWFIIDQAALHRIKDGRVMKPQIMKLVEITERPNVHVRIVPFSAGFYMGQGHDYTIFGFDTTPAVDIIYVEEHDGGEYVDNAKRTARYLTLWDQQKAAADGLKQTRQTLLEVAESM